LYALDEPGKHALARRFSFSQNVADKAELFRSNIEHALPDGLSQTGGRRLRSALSLKYVICCTLFAETAEQRMAPIRRYPERTRSCG
jgi:hypothetical protein